MRSFDYLKDTNFHNTFLSQPGNVSFVAKRGNSILLSILNKTLKTMPTAKLTGALSVYDNVSRKITLLDFIKDNLTVVAVGSVSLFVIILVIILGFLQKARAAEAKAKKAAVSLMSA